MSRDDHRGRSAANDSNAGKQQLDLRMLNQHAKRIDAEAERLERDRQELMNQRQESTQLTFGHRQGVVEAAPRQEYPTDRSYPVERNFNRGVQNRRHNGVPDTIIEESSRHQQHQSTYESVQSLKGMIDRLVDESKVQNEAVRARLREVQRKHQEVLNDLSGLTTKHTTVRQTALPDQPRPDRSLIAVETNYSNARRTEKAARVDIEPGFAKKATEPTRIKTQNKQLKDSDSLQLEYTEEPQNETLEIHYRRDIPVQDSFTALNVLEGRIVSEIVALRETKIKFMKALNLEVGNYNQLAEAYRQLEAENTQVRRRLQNLEAEGAVNQRPEQSEYRYRPTVHGRTAGVSSYDIDRLESENARLKQKLRRAAAFIQRVNVETGDQEGREDSSQLQRNLRNAEAEIEMLERELSKHRVGGNSTNHLDQEINDLRQALRQAQSNIEHLTAENRRLESRAGGSGEVQHQLEQLRLENDRLRKDTIEMLRVVQSNRNRDRPTEWGAERVTPRGQHSYSRQ